MGTAPAAAPTPSPGRWLRYRMPVKGIPLPGAGGNWPSPSLSVQGERPLVVSVGTLEEGHPDGSRLAGDRQAKEERRGIQAREGARAGEGQRGKKGQGAGAGRVRQAWGRRYPFAGQSERSVGCCHRKPAG